MVIVVVLVVLALSVMAIMITAVGINSKLLSLKNQAERAWAGIDTLLRQQFGEIPRLMEIVDRHATRERKSMDELVTARAQYAAAASIGEKITAAQAAAQAIQGIMAAGGAQPGVLADQEFQQLQQRLAGLESQLAERAAAYNEAASQLNASIGQFPAAIFARSLPCEAMPLFRVDAPTAARPSPSIKLAG